MYSECPVRSFYTGDISFSTLPLHRYYISDFVELCHRYSQLINPLIHLQRCLQNKLPSMNFWNDYDRVETYNRRINLEFFKFKRSTVFLRGELPFKENAELLIPDTLGGNRVNLDQWNKRLNHYDHRQGVWPDFKLFNKQKKKQKTIFATGETSLDLGKLSIEGMTDPDTVQLINSNATPVMNPSISTMGKLMSGGMQPGGMGGPGGAINAGMAGSGVGTAPGQVMGISTGGYNPYFDRNQLGKDAVPDYLSMGIAPTNYGINRENFIPIPNSIKSEQIRKNIALTFTGQYNERVKEDVGDISDLPKWMHQYVTVPQKQKDFQRFAEVDFIQSMRKRPYRQEPVSTLVEKSNEVPLIPRPHKDFELDPNFGMNED